jgi:hypothetical protein
MQKKLRFYPKAMCQAPDGKVYLAGWDYVLIYDNHYRPLGMISSNQLTGQTLSALAADGHNHLWAADDLGGLTRLTL